MKLRVTHLGLLVPLLLTACIFHKKQAPPVQALAPPASNSPKPEPVHPDLPASATTIPQQPLKPADDSTLPEKPVSRRHRQPKPAQTAPQQAATAAPAPAPAVSAMGELSTGEPSDLRHSVEDSISVTERAVNGIGRPLNDQEKNTAAQIREFLKQAREALAAADVTGARNLVSKARVLLSELDQ